MSSTQSGVVEQPLDLVRLSLEERVLVKLRNDREVKGVLHAYDQHLNMILGDVDETIKVIETDEETFEEIIQIKKRQFPLLFLRGDGIIMISPPPRAN